MLLMLGAKDIQTLKTFIEAESYDGPSIIIAYSPCIEHGFDLSKQHQQQELAVSTGHWPLYRYDPRNVEQGKNPLTLDSAKPSVSYSEFIGKEARFRGLVKHMGADSGQILASYDSKFQERYAHLEHIATGKDDKEVV